MYISDSLFSRIEENEIIARKFHDIEAGILSILNKREFSRASRYVTDLSLVFLDLDGFKRINDCHGHDVGDRALVLLASVLVKLKRESDVAARFRGRICHSAAFHHS